MFRLAKKPLPGLALLTLIPALLILSFFADAHSTWETRSEVNLNADLGHDTSLQTVAQNTLGAREGAIVRRVRTQLRIDDDERLILLEGMRGAVSFGTAKTANLDSLPVYIVGKTGTSTQVSWLSHARLVHRYGLQAG